MYLESGENDDQLRRPIPEMTVTQEATDNKKMATIIIAVCTNYKGQHLNRVLGGAYHQRQIAFTDIEHLPTYPYIKFEYHLLVNREDLAKHQKNSAGIVNT